MSLISFRSRTGQVCEGQGQCDCGTCVCDVVRPGASQTYSGRFCECNDYECDWYNGALCGGEHLFVKGRG